MAEADNSAEALRRRIVELEEEVARLWGALEALGATRTGDVWRPGEFELKRGLAASTRPSAG